MLTSPPVNFGSTGRRGISLWVRSDASEAGIKKMVGMLQLVVEAPSVPSRFHAQKAQA
jgi:hypothetical protein